MKKMRILATAAFLVAGSFAALHALSGYLSSFRSTYGIANTTANPLNSCSLCHPGGNASGGNLNGFASDYVGANYSFANIESLDSDGDGFTNIVEIRAMTFPGDSSSRPAVLDTLPPTVITFSIPSVSASLVVPITAFTASDTVGVTGYLVKETSTAPTAAATGWTATAPTSYTFASAGSKTLYAWAKDAAGNVSTSLSAATAIILSDTTAPIVTVFVIPSVSASLVVPITTLMASDTVGVAGYLVKETSTPPTASPTIWTATAPTSYTFASGGAKTLYAWARDAAGNVSAPVGANVTVTAAPAPDPNPAPAPDSEWSEDLESSNNGTSDGVRDRLGGACAATIGGGGLANLWMPLTALALAFRRRRRCGGTNLEGAG